MTAADRATTRAKRIKVQTVTRRLIIVAGISILVTGAMFSWGLFLQPRLVVSWLTLICGLVGGFVSIQQRLRKLDEEDLTMLSESWSAVLLIPIYGAIFSQVLYLIFLAGLLQGDLFPAFYIPPFGDVPTDERFHQFLLGTYPKTGVDFAKLLFWSFVAGFSERFVPQLVNAMSAKAQVATATDMTQEQAASVASDPGGHNSEASRHADRER
jgi:hypothetical protein